MNFLSNIEILWIVFFIHCWWNKQSVFRCWIICF